MILSNIPATHWDRDRKGQNTMSTRTIDIEGNAAICPPAGLYTFEITGITDPEERTGFDPDNVDTQSRVALKLSGYDYDEDDEDDVNWNGETVDVFYVWARTKSTGNQLALYKSPRANAGKLVKALYSLADIPSDFVLDLDDMIGKRFQAPLTEKDNGWPKVGDAMPVKQKAKKVKTVVPIQPALESDTDDDLFEEEI